MKTEIWNGHEIRFVEKDGEWWAVAADVAKAMGYIPFDELMSGGETITQRINIGEDFFALTSSGQVLYVGDFYLDPDCVSSIKAARLVEDILASPDLQYSKAFREAIMQLLECKFSNLFPIKFNSIWIKLAEKLGTSVDAIRTDMWERIHNARAEDAARDDDLRGVYFIRADNGLTKIGRTNNINTRFHALETMSPCSLKLEVFVKTSDEVALELKFHEIFAGKRAHGEWFRLADTDLEMVKKAEMTPDMLVDRQTLLDDTVELMGLKEKYHLDISVSDKIYSLAASGKLS